MNKPIPFGKYYLLERINVGGMAEVFKGKAFGVEGFERLVAVKRILPNIAEDEEFITMFIDEAKIAVQLQHANIAQIFDLGKVDDSYFIALEYVHGKDLRGIFDTLAKTEGAMPMAQACFIVMQVCEGLDYAHNKRDAQGRELNLVHRDVSPQNVLIGYEGEIKLVDFGIAKAAGKASKTQAGILKGKFGYMSPEQVRGLPVDRRSDIFSLGIVLYELLTGERLFVGESDFSTLEKVRNVEILPPSSFNKKIPAELERIALKALAKDVEDRYHNAIDLHDDLQAFLYSVGEFYSRKDLSGWMKKTFSGELEEANAKLEQLQQIDHVDEPTPLPPSGMTPVRANSSRGSAPKAAARADLEWDDEELETQIFDKGNEEHAANAAEVDDDELNSQDMIIQEGDQQPAYGAQYGAEYGDDKTVAGTPSAELIAEAEAQLARVPVRTATLPQRSLTPNAGRGLGGPPPGISAFRGPNMGPGGAVATQSYGINAYENGGMRGPYDGAAPSPALRHTLTGMPAPLPAPAGLPDRRPLDQYQRTGSPSKAPYFLLFLAVLIGGGFAGWKYISRPGKLQIVVKPGDAQISIDEAVLKGTSPITVERPPRKVYHLAVERDGYVRKDENIRLEPGQFERVELELEPSPDTGFELTSEPPGGLVWLDGQPFTSGDENAQQARTNFKAYRVAPGRHVIEIKGDPRYDDWKQEFFQEPGKTLKLRAELKPHSGIPGAPPVVAVPTPRPAPPPPAPKPEAKPEPKPAETPVAAKPPEPKPASPPPAAVVPKPAPPLPTPAVPKVAVATPPRPRPARPPAARPRVTEDVFEQETKLGAVAAAPAGDCMLTVGSKPWSEVWVDGKSTGKVTPLVDYKLSCGRHRITFKNPEIPVEKTETVNLRAGEKFKKVFALVDTGE